MSTDDNNNYKSVPTTVTNTTDSDNDSNDHNAHRHHSNNNIISSHHSDSMLIHNHDSIFINNNNNNGNEREPLMQSVSEPHIMTHLPTPGTITDHSAPIQIKKKNENKFENTCTLKLNNANNLSNISFVNENSS
eukprot:150543_1